MDSPESPNRDGVGLDVVEEVSDETRAKAEEILRAAEDEGNYRKHVDALFAKAIALADSWKEASSHALEHPAQTPPPTLAAFAPGIKDASKLALLVARGVLRPKDCFALTRFLEKHCQEHLEDWETLDNASAEAKKAQKLAEGWTVLKEDPFGKNSTFLALEKNLPFVMTNDRLRKLKTLLGAPNDPVTVITLLQRVGYRVDGTTIDAHFPLLQEIIRLPGCTARLEALSRLGLKAPTVHDGFMRPPNPDGSLLELLKDPHAVPDLAEACTDMDTMHGFQNGFPLTKEQAESLTAVAKDAELRELLPDALDAGSYAVPQALLLLKQEGLIPAIRKLALFTKIAGYKSPLESVLRAPSPESLEETRHALAQSPYAELLANDTADQLKTISALLGLKAQPDELPRILEHHAVLKDVAAFLYWRKQRGEDIRYEQRTLWVSIQNAAQTLAAEPEGTQALFDPSLQALEEKLGYKVNWFLDKEKLGRLHKDRALRERLLSADGVAMIGHLGPFTMKHYREYEAILAVPDSGAVLDCICKREPFNEPNEYLTTFVYPKLVAAVGAVPAADREAYLDAMDGYRNVTGEMNYDTLITASNGVIAREPEDRMKRTVVLQRLPERCLSMTELEEVLPILVQAPPDKLMDCLSIYRRIQDSPSQEIKRMKDAILGQMLATDDPLAAYDEIEGIFVRNNLPVAGKIFKVFEALYPPRRLRAIVTERTSPTLKAAGLRERYEILYRDLIRVHIASGNRSLAEYVERLEADEPLLEQAERDGLASLDPAGISRLHQFLRKLATLAGSAGNVASSQSRETSLDVLLTNVRSMLGVKEGQRCTERLAELFLIPAGVRSFSELRERMSAKQREAHERGLAYAAAGAVPIGPGDLIKAVDEKYIGNVLQNGSVAREFLGASSGSDLTPLDTDVSRVLPTQAGMTPAQCVRSSLGFGGEYGRLHLIIRDRGQMTCTRDASVPEGSVRAEPDALEIFNTEVHGAAHYGVRGGFGSTEIDGMVAEPSMVQDANRMENLYVEIAKNGRYIPVLDADGKELLTPTLFREYRRAFAGLSRYNGADEEALSILPTESHEPHAAAVDALMQRRAQERRETTDVAQRVRAAMESILAKHGIRFKAEGDSGILGAEWLDTGSSGRGTYAPGKFDFDFIVKLDTADYRKAQAIYADIKTTFATAKENSHTEGDTGYVQYRGMDVTAINGRPLDAPVDIDIGISSKAEAGGYETHDVLRDKYAYIQQRYGEAACEQVKANIALAKQTLKAGSAYKKQEHGGMGGVGVETWLLQHGGNMQAAFQAFWDAAHDDGRVLPLEEFQKRYRIIDAGLNVKKQRHDNFALILKEEGYNNMLAVIGKFLGSGLLTKAA